MQKIKIIEFKSTGIYPEFKYVHSIEISDSIMESGEGGFGKVYHCISVNNKKCKTEQVIKILKKNNNSHLKGYNTVQKLQNKLNQKHNDLLQSKNISLLEHYPALKGIPQFSFKGKFNGDIVYGYSANNLLSLQFESYETLFENQTLAGISLTSKFQMAYHLVNAFDFLQNIYFIHADFKEEALFLNKDTNECAIIDYDSGAIMNNPNDQPTTIGALQYWLAPEILGQLHNSDSNNKIIHVDLFSDLWSVSIGIFHLLFSTHPLFMLKSLGVKTIQEYLSSNKWPEINTNESYFNLDNIGFYNQFLHWYKKNIPIAIQNKLENTINSGYQNPALRSSCSNWKIALKSTLNPPSINLFEADNLIKSDATPTNLRWDIKDATEAILLPENRNVTNLTEFKVNPTKETVFTLVVKNHFGESKKSLTISINKKPPLFKKFEADKLIRTDANPIKISWEIENAHELVLMPDNVTISGQNSVFVKPLENITYTLVAKSFFGVKSQKSIDINISKDPPVIHCFTANKNIRTNADPIKISWKVDNAHELIIMPDNISVNGKNSIIVEPLDNTNYTLIAKSFFGVKSQKSIDIAISKDPPVIHSFTANKKMRTNADPIKLLWKVDNAAEIILNPNNINVTGKKHIEIEPLKDTNYKLVAKSFFDIQTETEISIQVSKEPPVIKYFKYNLINILTDEYELKWETERAVQCSISPNVEIQQNSNKVKIKLMDNYNFILKAESLFGIKAIQSLIIQPIFNRPPKESLFFLPPDEKLFNTIKT